MFPNCTGLLGRGRHRPTTAGLRHRELDHGKAHMTIALIGRAVAVVSWKITRQVSTLPPPMTVDMTNQ
jgi:hypothetical protein